MIVIRAQEKTIDELRAEAERIRVFALSVVDPEVMTELQFMIEELEHRLTRAGVEQAGC